MKTALWIAVGTLLLAACGTNPTQQSTQAPPSEGSEVSSPAPTSTLEQFSGLEIDEDSRNRRVAGVEPFVPIQLIRRDGIRPVYQPEFRSAGEAELLDDELVLGVALGDEAKAYPISVLRFREMVNDEMAGIPTLVTW